MDHKWLEDFIALARERSLSRAAELRHVTQPQFSRLIRALELWVGADLINRASMPLGLTAAGEDLLPVACHAAVSLTPGAVAGGRPAPGNIIAGRCAQRSDALSAGLRRASRLATGRCAAAITGDRDGPGRRRSWTLPSCRIFRLARRLPKPSPRSPMTPGMRCSRRMTTACWSCTRCGNRAPA